MLALSEFHRMCPDQEIHVYGAAIGDPGFPVTVHGRLTPAQLNDLYNSCAAGVAMSFTNISLVTEEMLAAGCIPVVNHSRDARADLNNPYVAWATPAPVAMARALRHVVAATSPARSAAVAASVVGSPWSETGRQVASILEDLARGPGSPPDEPQYLHQLSVAAGADGR